MIKFICKSFFFIFPFIGMFFWNFMMYEVNGHDLLRMGYIPDFYKDTKEKISKNNLKNQYYYSKINLIPKNIDFLVIGDSFSEGENSYTNLLAKRSKVLKYVNKNPNPISRLLSLIKSDFFDKNHVKYVVLENVERYVVDRGVNIYSNTSIFSKNQKSDNLSNKHVFFSNQSILFTYNSFRYLFFKDILINNNVYSLSLNKKMFNHFKGDEILIFKEDFDVIDFNNNLDNLQRLNNVINTINQKLNKKGVKLIFFICPDKYDLYYPYLKIKYKKPIFFESFDFLNKNYYYLDSKKILNESLRKNIKDLYFYDDTHWTFNSYKLFSDTLLSFL
jgi:hypothetical protein